MTNLGEIKKEMFHNNRLVITGLFIDTASYHREDYDRESSKHYILAPIC